MAILLDYDLGFELDQGKDPRCWTILSGSPEIGKVIGHCSSFSNEDLPSNYLGIVSAGKNVSFEYILSLLGGGEQRDIDLPPDEYWGHIFSPVECGLGFCGKDVPNNNQCTLKVYDPLTKSYANQPWTKWLPPVLLVNPIGFGTYWGYTLSDFLTIPVPVQTPPPPPQRTPEPPIRK